MIKRTVFYLTFLIPGIFKIGNSKAQVIPDPGYVKMNVEFLNSQKSGDLPDGLYTFSMDNGSPLGFSENDDYIDIAFSGDFEKNNKSYFLTGSFRIIHPKIGTFFLRKGYKEEDPPNLAKASLNINNNIVLMDQSEGTQGKIILTNYQNSKQVTGTFELILGDSPDPSVKKHLYKLTGDFKINNIQ